MSAWIVSQDTIDLMVTAAMRSAGWNEKYINIPETADLLGKALWKENYNSVNHRYDERKRTPAYHWTPVAEVQEEKLRPEVLVQILHAAHCYDYQSCEHPAWSDSLAYWASQAIQAWAETLLLEMGWPKNEYNYGGDRPDWKGTKLASWGWDRTHGFALTEKA
jgi:hypothetical protein